MNPNHCKVCGKVIEYGRWGEICKGCEQIWVEEQFVGGPAADPKLPYLLTPEDEKFLRHWGIDPS